MDNSNSKDKTKAMVQIVFGATVWFVCVSLGSAGFCDDSNYGCGVTPLLQHTTHCGGI